MTEIFDELLTSLTPAEYNPRTISEAQFESLKASMRANPEMLWARPVIALLDGTVICGNMRVRAAIDMKLQTIPVYRVDLDEKTAKEWMLRDNNSYGEWQPDELAEMVYSLRESGSQVATLGFTDRELAEILDSVSSRTDVKKRERGSGQAEGLSLMTKWGVEQGQVWGIKSNRSDDYHKIACMDSTDADNYLDLFSEGAVSKLILFDPPYDNDKDFGFYGAILGNAYEWCSGNSPIYQWVTDEGLRVASYTWEQLDLMIDQQIVWAKLTSNIGRHHFQSQHQVCFYGWKAKQEPVQDRRPPYSATSLWTVELDPSMSLNPEQKPVEIFAKPIRYHLKPGECAFDPCLGSGSSIVAAENEGRICYGFEIDPMSVAIILERLSNEGLSPEIF